MARCLEDFSGSEHVLAFQFDAWVDEDGEFDVRVVGLPVLEDTQREREEMAITMVHKSVVGDAECRAILVARQARCLQCFDFMVTAPDACFGCRRIGPHAGHSKTRAQ